VKRELCVVNRYFILLLLACFFVTHASRLAAQPWFDGNDENKAKDKNAAAPVTSAKDGSNGTKEDGAATAVKDGAANVAKDESKAKEDVKRDTPGSVLKPGQTMHMDVDLALVNVTVTDPYNRLVTGLDTDNFRVFEDNTEQEVVTFSSEDVPISMA